MAEIAVTLCFGFPCLFSCPKDCKGCFFQRSKGWMEGQGKAMVLVFDFIFPCLAGYPGKNMGSVWGVWVFFLMSGRCILNFWHSDGHPGSETFFRPCKLCELWCVDHAAKRDQTNHDEKGPKFTEERKNLVNHISFPGSLPGESKTIFQPPLRANAIRFSHYI